MIKDPRDFDGALSGYNDILKQLKKAKTRDEISTLERRGISAMREVQTSANYIGYKLKAAVADAYQRLQEALTKALEEKEEPKEEAPSLTPEEEAHFTELKELLAKAEKRFKDGAVNKETKEAYRTMFLTIAPFSTDNHRYGVIVALRGEKEELTFRNEGISQLLEEFEPVKEEKPKGRPRKSVKKEEKADA